MKTKVRITFFGEPQFFVNEEKRSVACRLTGYIQGLDEDCFPDFVTRTGVAKCHPDDEFDVEIGKKIAHAKAENQVYKAASKICRAKMLDILQLSDDINVFLAKSHDCRNHNIKYIERLTEKK